MLIKKSEGTARTQPAAACGWEKPARLLTSDLEPCAAAQSTGHRARSRASPPMTPGHLDGMQQSQKAAWEDERKLEPWRVA